MRAAQGNTLKSQRAALRLHRLPRLHSAIGGCPLSKAAALQAEEFRVEAQVQGRWLSNPGLALFPAESGLASWSALFCSSQPKMPAACMPCKFTSSICKGLITVIPIRAILGTPLRRGAIVIPSMLLQPALAQIIYCRLSSTS